MFNGISPDLRSSHFAADQLAHGAAAGGRINTAMWNLPDIDDRLI
jgi:hypothetical protein